jgi:2-dehydro-3-deoxyphosphogalactonate aldolase
VSDALVDAGFAIVEVPLNSPRPLESIERLHEKFGDEILIGAGTVMSPAQVKEIAAAGGRLIVHAARRCRGRSRGEGGGTGVHTGNRHADRGLRRARQRRRRAQALPRRAAHARGAEVDAGGLSVDDAVPSPSGGSLPTRWRAMLPPARQGSDSAGRCIAAGDEPSRVAANARDFVAAWKRLRSVAG